MYEVECCVTLISMLFTLVGVFRPAPTADRIRISQPRYADKIVWF